MPTLRVPLPSLLRSSVERHYIDISLSRVLPLGALMTFGILVGLVFTSGLDHPYDKLLHVVFFALLTLSVHTLFCCRLRISAVVAFALGAFGELVQALTPHHHASVLDAVANGVGVALVVGLIALWRSERRQALASAAANLDDLLGAETLQPAPVRLRSSSVPSDR
ncbi:antibiotic resistance protein VanZ [Polymorphum gilvum]|uniref:antibiotic resistance protein VanZ n=1 Tax=Polymorphum gilvum TaxID=991904 RepID=UPI00059EC6B1|nr:antibiotic resistance protein VanZ [Polymorphum gilvum]